MKKFDFTYLTEDSRDLMPRTLKHILRGEELGMASGDEVTGIEEPVEECDCEDDVSEPTDTNTFEHIGSVFNNWNV